MCTRIIFLDQKPKIKEEMCLNLIIRVNRLIPVSNSTRSFTADEWF